MHIINLLRNKISNEGIKYTIVRIVHRLKENIYLFLSRIIFFPCKTDNIIVIESHNDFDCNGGAFYDYLIDHGINKKWSIVWLVRNAIPHNMPSNVYAFNFWKFSFRKEYFMNKAKYLLCDDKFIKKRRKKQIEIYCQHGLSFKNVKGHINAPHYVDYILSSSENYDPFLCENIGITYPNNKMIHCGYLYNDLLYQNCSNEVKKITQNDYKKIFLWMPTFRKKNAHRNDSNIDFPLGIPLFNDDKQLKELNCYLKAMDCLLIIKIHPMQYELSYQKLKDMSNIIILDADRVKKLDVDNYRLMKYCDALISDYSSVAYSYLLLNKPMGFVLADLDDYKIGLSVDDIDEFLPGFHIYSREDLLEFIQSVNNNMDQMKEKRMKLMDFLYTYKDGKSCARLAEFMNL